MMLPKLTGLTAIVVLRRAVLRHRSLRPLTGHNRRSR